MSFEVQTPEVWLTRKYGVIAIDTNASPLHLAIAEISPDGNLLSYQSVSLHEFLNCPKNIKDYKEWLLAHEIVNIATQKGKAIAIEDLKKVNKGSRGDGRAKLRKRLHYWNFKSLLSKIERVAKLKGVEVVKVYPAYTSVIGSLKYAPQLGIDKDVAGAFVIGRKAFEEKEKELREQLKKETNQYKRNATNSELKGIQRAKAILLEELKSLQSEPSRGKEADGRNPEQVKSAWRVLKVAVILPLLGKSFVRDFSPLKSLLIEGKWQRRADPLVPALLAGATPRHTG